VVLTGGGALMPGAADLAYDVFGLPVRVGSPSVMGGMVEEYRNPLFSTAVGLVQLGAERIGPPPAEARARGNESAKPRSEGLAEKLRGWLKEFF